MIKTLNNTLKQDKEEKYQISKNVQDMIPIWTIYPDGIFSFRKKQI